MSYSIYLSIRIKYSNQKIPGYVKNKNQTTQRSQSRCSIYLQREPIQIIRGILLRVLMMLIRLLTVPLQWMKLLLVLLVLLLQMLMLMLIPMMMLVLVIPSMIITIHITTKVTFQRSQYPQFEVKKASSRKWQTYQSPAK